ncbi:MAG: InlB B-repeat-containing protein, partial [Alphaproteobacteria bacterium]|nr:InlB B-repeat-containing protein [Alphaproteobacteria bacterium]
AGTSINPWKVADDITLTATWTPINYTITYQDNTSDTNGTALYGSLTGSVPAAQTISYDNTVNLTSMTGTRTGYSFQGWSGNKNVRALDGTGNMDYSNGESVTYVYPGDATLTALWNPNKSGAITLISSVYPGNNTSQTATYTTTTTEAVTPATTSTIYSVYNNGLYKDSSHGTPIVASEEIPVKAGYTFGGFYNSGMTDQYITPNGAATDKGKRAVTANGGTATWYARWTPKTYNVVYNKGTCTYGDDQSAAYTHTDAATYDSNWTALSASLSANPKIGAPATGWTFDGWTTKSTPTYNGNTLEDKVTSYSPWKLTDALNLYGACTPNISGAITLDSKKYASTSDTTGTAATTNASAATLYSVYDYAMYTTKPTKANYTTATQYTTLATAPVQTGYTFAGFYTGKAGSGTKVINSDKTFTDAAKTLVTAAGGTATWYAHYTANTYNVTYAADGTGCTGTSVTHTGGATYNATYTPLTFGATTPVNISGITAKTGYHFYQWNDGTTDRPAGTGFTWTYTSAKTLTSVCKGNISGAIKLDSKKYESSAASSGTNPTTESNPTTVYSVYKQGIYDTLPTDAAPGTALTTITVPTLTGYTFGGYYTTKTGTGTQLIDGEGNVLAVANQQVTTAGATPTWYAKWTANKSTITYTCGTKPSGASTNITGTAPSTVTNQAYDAEYTLSSTANTCALPGYHFNGWSCDYNLATGAHTTTSYAGGASGTFKSTSNVICAAVWEANTIALTWSANGGNAQGGGTYAPGAGTDSCTYDGSITLPAVPEKNGYTFTGWSVTSTNP